jgi:hypothetical protein
VRENINSLVNPFVNPQKRGLELPKGCKDLGDLLQHSSQAKCEYCGEPAIATPGWAADYRWCALCNHDLRDFARIEVKVHFKKYQGSEMHSEAEISQYRAEMQRRQDDFMRDRIKQRD